MLPMDYPNRSECVPVRTKGQTVIPLRAEWFQELRRSSRQKPDPHPLRVFRWRQSSPNSAVGQSADSTNALRQSSVFKMCSASFSGSGDVYSRGPRVGHLRAANSLIHGRAKPRRRQKPLPAQAQGGKPAVPAFLLQTAARNYLEQGRPFEMAGLQGVQTRCGIARAPDLDVIPVLPPIARPSVGWACEVCGNRCYACAVELAYSSTSPWTHRSTAEIHAELAEPCGKAASDRRSVDVFQPRYFPKSRRVS